MPFWFADWTLRKRSGHDTPSFEEWFWYQVTPGSTWKSMTSDDEEYLDYYATSSLVWLGGIAWAADAVLVAEAAGTTAIASELVLYRALTTTAGGVMAAVPVGLYVVNKEVIESAPEEEQPGLWQMFSQALTGTGWGVGSGASRYV